MRAKANFSPVAIEAIASRITTIRGERVLLDADLAALYGVETRRLNEQVRRNRRRFPADFIFRLTRAELDNLMSQSATSRWGGRRKLPHAFTEHGAIQAATVLNTRRAVEVSVYVVRAFVQLRGMIVANRELAKRLDELKARPSSTDQAGHLFSQAAWLHRPVEMYWRASAKRDSSVAPRACRRSSLTGQVGAMPSK
jgi:hypothetical protein